ncbi:MAG: hypothetical protein FJZ11_00600 [Candidatus Omnitrophica bacterium]|nr:hypothetical protein [Candidatus Omnitrophota bacterium]
MTKKSLTINDVFNIRKGGNPERAFAPQTLHRDLYNKSYLELVGIFESRISKWYFDVAESLSENTDSNFIVTAVCCIILDLLSQYIYGVPSSSKKCFKKFFKDHLNEYNHSIQPPIESCYYDKKKKWVKERINDISEGFYHCFRCGIVHSGRILEYGRINTLYPNEIIKIIDWQKEKKEININPKEFLRKMREIFNNYIKNLRNNDSELKRNFINKMKLEYGMHTIPE